MPLNYTTAQVVLAAKTAVKVQNTGINIRLPLSDAASTVAFPLKDASTVTFYFVALDSVGNRVGEKALDRSLEFLKAKYPAEFATVYGILKRVAYKEAQESGTYPQGTVT